MNKPIVIVIVLAVLGLSAYHLATRGPRDGSAAVVAGNQDNARSDRKAVGWPARAAGKATDPAADGLALARLEDVAARDAALAAWAARFTTNESILAVIAALRADPHSSPELRALIAPHLTRQWARVDGPACIAAYLREGALHRRDPLDSHNNPFAAPDRTSTVPAANLFSLIAETNPAAFASWLQSAPADLIPALLGDDRSATWLAWNARDTSGDKAIRDSDPILAQNFLRSDFAMTMATRAPDVLVRPALDGRDLGLNRRYYNGLLEMLGARQDFAAALARTHSPEQLWDIFGKASSLAADFNEDPRAPFLALARLEANASGRSLGDAVAAAIALPADYRQAATFSALMDSLAPSAGETYWDGLNTLANALNATATKADAVKEITRVNFYADLRARMAAALAKEDLEAALAWTGSIRDERNRASCLMRIAAQDLQTDARAWASGQVGADDGDETITLHLEDHSANPPVLKSFTLPPVEGESLPQYYTRLRAAMQNTLGKTAAPVAP